MITADQRTTSRVLMLTADYPPTPWSGVGVAVGRLAEALERQRVRVTVLVGGPRARATCALDPAEAPAYCHCHLPSSRSTHDRST